MKKASKGRKSIVVKTEVVKRLVADTKNCGNQREAMAQVAERYGKEIGAEKPISIGWIWNVLKQLNLLDSLPKGRAGKTSGSTPRKVRVPKSSGASGVKVVKTQTSPEPNGTNGIDHAALTGPGGIGKTNAIVASSAKGLSEFERKFYNIKGKNPSDPVASADPQVV